jgi:hypothetical protein
MSCEIESLKAKELCQNIFICISGYTTWTEMNCFKSDIYQALILNEHVKTQESRSLNRKLFTRYYYDIQMSAMLRTREVYLPYYIPSTCAMKLVSLMAMEVCM